MIRQLRVNHNYFYYDSDQTPVNFWRLYDRNHRKKVVFWSLKTLPGMNSHI